MQALEKPDAAYEYYRKAYETDPTYVEAAEGYGRLRLGVRHESLANLPEMLRSLEMMRQYVDRYPDDVYESLYYGYVAGQLDTLGEAVRVFERTAKRHPQKTTALLHLSEAYANNDRLREAAEALDRYERIEGFSPNITLRKITFYLAEKDTVAAKREADRMLAQNPKDANYVMIKGNFYDVINEKDSALACYMEAERLDPEAGAPKLALADAYKERGDSALYDAKIYELLLSEDYDLEGKTQILAQYLQNLFIDKNDTRRGDNLFSTLREQYPHAKEIRDLAARYAAAKGNFKEAEEEISYAIDQDLGNTTYWGQLMTYQATDNRADEALQTYERAKSHIKPDYTLKMYHAAVAQQANRYDIAFNDYRQMIQEIDSGVNPSARVKLSDLRKDMTMEELDRMATLFVTMGDAYHMAQMPDSSYLAYDNALELDPGNVLAKNNYAYFLTEDGGDLAKARKLVEEVMDTPESANPTYIDTYAWILYKSGDLEKALEQQKHALEQAEGMGYKSAELYMHYGDMLLDAKRPQEAVEQYEKGLELVPEKFTDEQSVKQREELNAKLKKAQKALGN